MLIMAERKNDTTTATTTHSDAEVCATRSLFMPRLSLREVKREWPLRLAKMFLFSLVLGGGILLGLFFTLHVSGISVDRSYYASQRLPQSGPANFQEWLSGPSWKHNLSDSELLWLASMDSQRRGFPAKRVPKVAFMFLTRGPLPLALLWERFFTACKEGEKKLYSIYVHATPGYSLDVLPSSVFFGRQIPSQVAKWGEMSMCDAERRLLANALLDHSNERFILLSETCIPLHPFRDVYSHLIGSEHSFIAAFDELGPYGRGRYDPRMSPEVLLTQWRKGSQWFEVSRKLAIYIVSDTLYYPKFRDFCRPACYVDEHYLHTMLSLEFPSEIANRSVTWVDWSRGGSHPAMFGTRDITESFLSKLTGHHNCTYNGSPDSLCFLFARKFAPNTLEPLLKLSHKILGM